MNKDFLKEVLVGEKKLLPMTEVSRINMPMFDELSVTNIWPQLHHDEKFCQYFPSKLPKGRMPDRNYFFNILHTIYPEYSTSIMRHANESRTQGLA